MKKALTFLLVAIISIVAFMVPASAATAKLEATGNIRSDEISTNYIKLKWDKVDGANKYAVYYSTTYSGKYTKYTTVSKPQATLKNLKKNKLYYVKVKALKVTNGKTVKSSNYSEAALFRTRKDKMPKETPYDGTMDKDGSYNLIYGDLYIRIVPRLSISAVLDNRFSEYNGKKVIGIFAEVFNLSDKTRHLNQFNVKFFSPSGKNLDDLQYYFEYGDYIYNDLLPGKGVAGVFLMPYSKAGKYTISFSGGYGEDDTLIQLDMDERVLSFDDDQEYTAEWLDGITEAINE